MTATITGPGEEVARVPGLLDALVREHNVDANAVADMQVALDEVLSNILGNGFADGIAHRVDITLAVDSDRLTAEVLDDCGPFDPLAVPPPELGAPLLDRRVGGLGVHFVRNLMSDVRYTRVGARNRLVLTKKLAREDDTDAGA
ncbi:MAG: ATP-binding protein [Burkholderiales bacterium]|nr:ATP-binding protein [Burkholderiales bacterium]